jgi:hypothetical protein
MRSAAWCSVERARVVVARRAGHPGIAVPEESLPIDAQDLAGAHELPGPDLAESWAHRRCVHVVDIAFLTPSCGEQNDTDTVVMGAEHESTRRDALIVGMRVNEQKSGHAEPLYARSETTRFLPWCFAAYRLRSD